MDDNAKNTCSYQVDQDLLDARGINMTVEEVAGLSTGKYSERVQSLKLCDEDLIFLKGLRRRIKNRLASQNSRRRSVEHLRRLTRELRAVRACRRDALAERRALVLRRDVVRDKCASLRRHLLQILKERSDTTEVPSIDVEIESRPYKEIAIKKVSVTETKTPLISHCLKPDQHISVIVKNDIDREKLRKELEQEADIYERVRQELQKEREVNETIIFKDVERETIIIKEEAPDYDEITIEDDFESQRANFEFNQEINCEFDQERSCEFDQDPSCEFDQDKSCEFERSSEFETRTFENNYGEMVRSELSRDRHIFECKIGKLVTQSVNHMFNDKKKVFAKTVFISNDKLTSNIKTMVLTEGNQDNGVLNLSVKEGRRKNHGRKQSAPRRIAYYADCDDGVLDLKVKKELQ